MENTSTPTNLDFLSSRGEMGERIHNFDLSKTSLGIMKIEYDIPAEIHLNEAETLLEKENI